MTGEIAQLVLAGLVGHPDLQRRALARVSVLQVAARFGAGWDHGDEVVSVVGAAPGDGDLGAGVGRGRRIERCRDLVHRDRQVTRLVRLGINAHGGKHGGPGCGLGRRDDGSRLLFFKLLDPQPRQRRELPVWVLS